MFSLALRLRALPTGSAAFGLVAVLIMVGALFPAVGDSIGKLNLPKGVSNLLGGADYGTLSGWLNGEIAAVYGPLVIAAMAITGAAGATAGEEEDRILGLVLAHPVRRSVLVVAKGAAIAATVLAIALATWAGLIASVAVAGGGIGLGDLAALALHLAFFGIASGAVALALGAATGRRAVATGGAAAVLGYLINGVRPAGRCARVAQVRLAVLLLHGPRPAEERRRPRRSGRAGTARRGPHRGRDGGDRAPGPAGVRTLTDRLPALCSHSDISFYSTTAAERISS